MSLVFPVSFTALLRLTRFWNLLIIAVSQYATAGMLINYHLLTDMHLFFLSMSTTVVAAAGYVINDYYDIKIDLINKPERVVIGKGITRRYAILIHSILSFAGVGIGVLLDWRIGAINFISAFVLWWYSNNLKRQPFVGNFAIGLLTGLSVAIVNVYFHVNYIMVYVYALFAFFITLVREIIKDMEDLKGDHTFGCKTLPIIWGIRKTKQLLYGLIFLFGLLVFFLNRALLGLPAGYFSLILFAPLGWLVVLLIRADTVKDYYNLSQFCKIIMLIGILSMVLV